jgi:hypothetical protein
VELETWLKSPSIKSLKEFSVLFGLNALDKALVLSTARQADPKSPFLVVCNQSIDARNLIDNLNYFLGSAYHKNIFYLPPPPFDFYRGLLPNPGEIVEIQRALRFVHKSPQGLEVARDKNRTEVVAGRRYSCGKRYLKNS